MLHLCLHCYLHVCLWILLYYGQHCSVWLIYYLWQLWPNDPSYLYIFKYFLICILWERTLLFGCGGLLCQIARPFDRFSRMLQQAKLNNLYAWMISQLVLIHVLHCWTIFEAIYKCNQQWENACQWLFYSPQLLKCCFSCSSPHRNRPTGRRWRCLIWRK